MLNIPRPIRAVNSMNLMEYAFYIFKLVTLGCVVLGFLYAWAKIKGNSGTTINNYYYGNKKK